MNEVKRNEMNETSISITKDSRASPLRTISNAPERIKPALGSRGDDGVHLTQLSLGASRRPHGAATGENPKDGANRVRERPKYQSKRRRRDVDDGVFKTQRRGEVFDRHEPSRDDIFIRLGVAPESTLHLDGETTLLRLGDGTRGAVNLEFKQHASVA
jgi:hypothetical protein